MSKLKVFLAAIDYENGTAMYAGRSQEALGQRVYEAWVAHTLDEVPQAVRDNITAAAAKKQWLAAVRTYFAWAGRPDEEDGPRRGEWISYDRELI